MAKTVVVRQRWALMRVFPWSAPMLAGAGIWMVVLAGWPATNDGPMGFIMAWPVVAFAVHASIPRRGFEMDAAGVLVGRAAERLGWSSISGVLVVDLGGGRSWAGLRRPQKKTGSKVADVKERLSELPAPPRFRQAGGKVSVLRLDLGRWATLDGDRVEPRRLAERLEGVARIPVRLVVAEDHGRLRVRAGFGPGSGRWRCRWRSWSCGWEGSGFS
ncbi:hypothetical protein J4573_35865 [Actinomadura barringtoniae]|uniref:Uncharacterized protein n=1 Tax=Actinomadura barringtoniae TaxID=1427535 RepID=A0A939TDP8_9ACTN|nr:hypothetical protein [Actinomadura barringtoniae]MBO2452515.1 hypothetical protein [Actinomadura barringtoniae]